MSERTADSLDKICKKHGLTSHALEVGKKYWKCRKCRYDNFQKRRKAVKEKSVLYLGGSCCRCGYNKCLAALEFHHTDPAQKDFSVMSGSRIIGWEKVRKELDKCILLCANCHREEHARLMLL